jgi:hypothetical protein
VVRNQLIRCTLLASALALSVSPLNAGADQGRGQGKGHEEKAKAKDQGRDRDRDRDEVVIDREGHRRVVHEYYTSNALPPGLAKRQSLPPGLAKQLRERGELPPGLQKRLTPVPAPLSARLPGLPPYYSRYFAGDDMLIVDTRTNRILSLIPKIF